MLLQPFINYFNFAERKSVKPVDFRQMAIAMFLTQLTRAMMATDVDKVAVTMITKCGIIT